MVHYNVKTAIQEASTNYTILIGHLYAKIRYKQDDSEFVVRPHGYRDRNEGGKILIEFLLQQKKHEHPFLKKGCKESGLDSHHTV